MFSYLRISLAVVMICLQQLSHAGQIDPGVKRILFLGNSITWQANYIIDVEVYLTVHYPGRQFEIINAGVPSETVSGLSEPGHAGGSFPRPDLHERLKRVLEQTKPDLVFACYGMNDGIYLPLDKERFQKFKDGINWLHSEVIKTGAKIIHLTPPNYDELKGKSRGYANVLDRYTDWLLTRRSSAKWEVIDIHYPMQKYLEAHRKVDARFGVDGFALAADGVHPNETGHWIMAKQILLYLGYKEVAAASGLFESLPQTPSTAMIVKRITERHHMMRDAWLSVTKHLRPGLPAGLPLLEAKARYDELDKEIKALIQVQDK